MVFLCFSAGQCRALSTSALSHSTRSLLLGSAHNNAWTEAVAAMESNDSYWTVIGLSPVVVRTTANGRKQPINQSVGFSAACIVDDRRCKTTAIEEGRLPLVAEYANLPRAGASLAACAPLPAIDRERRQLTC